MSLNLFSGISTHDLFRNNEAKLRDEIDSYNADLLLNTSPNDLENYFFEKYSLSAPVILEDEVVVDHEEYLSDGHNAFGDRIKLKTTKYFFFIPFEGNVDMFTVSPRTRTIYNQNIEIHGRELKVHLLNYNNDPNQLRGEIQNFLDLLKIDLNRLHSEIDNFNSNLRPIITKNIDLRRSKLLSDRNTVAAIGFPLRQRQGASKTYVVPEVRRRLELRPPAATTVPFKPDPTLDMKEYENILDIMFNMALVMERSPSRFIEVKEEELRDHFLVQLNGQYEGQATGETFNAAGKTDILIRNEGKNLFIAECKFWGGEKKYLETIDQLLTYITWRDTKTSVVVFNRRKNFSTVLDAIKLATVNHPNYKREAPYNKEAGFRYIFHHSSDKNKELILTVLAFDIPSPFEETK